MTLNRQTDRPAAVEDRSLTGDTDPDAYRIDVEVLKRLTDLGVLDVSDRFAGMSRDLALRVLDHLVKRAQKGESPKGLLRYLIKNDLAETAQFLTYNTRSSRSVCRSGGVVKQKDLDEARQKVSDMSPQDVLDAWEHVGRRWTDAETGRCMFEVVEDPVNDARVLYALSRYRPAHRARLIEQGRLERQVAV